jgi:hypothetical protein
MIEPHTVRQSIRETLWALGASPDARLGESLLIREGNYCGHRFQCDGYEAVWFIEEEQVKFYGPTGAVLEAVEVPELLTARSKRPIRRAA